MNYFLLLIAAMGTTICRAQFVVPQTIPCITITSTNVPTLGGDIHAPDCIDTDGNVTFLQDQNYILKAGEYISFGQNTVIDPDYSHQFHAYIDTSGMDIAWYYPNATPGSVYQYDKLELGVRFQENIETYIQNFNNEIAATQINPFDPEELDLKAEFWYYSTTLNDWVQHQQVYGFYYEEYQRNPSGAYPNGQWIKDNANQHRFRIRFAPRLAGLWKCKVSADVPGYGSFEASTFTFECLPSIDNNPGYLRVGDNKRYFRRGNEPFFPVGHNLTWPRNYSFGWEEGFNPITPAPVYEDFHDQMDSLKLCGANYFRFINTPWATDIEFEKLGDYSDRMRQAWEMDQVILKAEDLDLLIHWNLDIGSAFTDRGGGSTWYDWTKEGDPNAGVFPCALPSGYDNGYCYHAEIPECVHPIDFLTSATAQKHYKNKLRYLIARYSYSTSIGMIEVYSEVNHFGKEFTSVYNDTLCKSNQLWHPYKQDSVDVPPLIYAWNEIMTEHVQSMNIYQHPIVLSYSPEPDFYHGDFSYSLSSVDVASWNLYQTDITKYTADLGQTVTWQNLGGLDKPVIHSEFGAFGSTGTCDNGAQFRQILCLTPFIGSACSMNWDWQYPDQSALWPQIGIVKDLLEGIPLDEDNWTVAIPALYEDERIEVLYLQQPKMDGYRKAVGAISNRTYNFYTAGVEETECVSSKYEPAEIFQTPINFPYLSLAEPIKIPDMGFSNDYVVDWVNAFTGEVLTSTLASTTLLSQNLELAYPVTLQANANGAILFFQVYPLGSSIKSAELSDESSNPKVLAPLQNQPDSVRITDWTNMPLTVNVSPNPGNSLVAVTLLPNNSPCTWILYDIAGQIVLTGKTDKSTFELDLTALMPGVYTLTCESNKKSISKKIIKT